MKRFMLFCAVAGFGLVGVVGQANAAPPDCEPSRCAVQSAIESECPCFGVPGGTAAANHGRYVSCVARVVKELSKDGDIPTNCKGKVKRCAARSVCGKEGAVTCNIPRLGTCDTANGFCVENPALACESDADCVLSTRCKIKRSAELCLAKGGTVGTSPTCCPDCGE